MNTIKVVNLEVIEINFQEMDILLTLEGKGRKQDFKKFCQNLSLFPLRDLKYEEGKYQGESTYLALLSLNKDSKLEDYSAC